MLEREREVARRFLAEPTDINFGGKVHGGAVMKWIDRVGYARAVGWSGQYCVTVYVGGIRFYKPVRIGKMVEVRARVVYTGRTSMRVVVEVSANDPKDRRHTKTTHCVIVFVAVDEQGTSVEVARWRPETEEDETLERYAKKLMRLRKGMEETEAPSAEPCRSKLRSSQASEADVSKRVAAGPRRYCAAGAQCIHSAYQEGSGTFWSLTWPRAISFPSSLRVMITCQSCCPLP